MRLSWKKYVRNINISHVYGCSRINSDWELWLYYAKDKKIRGISIFTVETEEGIFFLYQSSRCHLPSKDLIMLEVTVKKGMVCATKWNGKPLLGAILLHD